MKRTRTDGSITVYLSLILVLILSLILTITEGARVSTARVFAGRAFSTAMDSVMAQYYGPLWKEYHIFGLYMGEQSDMGQEEVIAQRLSEYMSYTFDPDLGLGDNAVDLYDITTESVSVKNKTFLMDYQGDLLMKEASEYMKYREAGDQIKLLLDKLSLFDTPQKVSYIYEKKQEVEGNLVEIDKGILKLMELLDGLCTSKKGIKISKKQELAVQNYFVKKICCGVVSKETVGINHEKVFLALKNRYVDPTTEFANIANGFARISGAFDQINTINANKVLSEASDQKKASKQKEAEEEIVNLYQEISQNVSDITATKESISELIDGIKPIAGKAITTIDDILLKTKTAAPLIKEYETFLSGFHDQMDEETYSGLEDSLKEIKKYVDVKGGYDFEGMKVILKKDYDILTQTQEYLKEGVDALSGQRYEEAAVSFQYAADLMKSYQIKGLTLDYSTLALDNSTKEDPLSAINNLMKSGITSLVIDTKQISDKKLTQGTLPSQVAALSDEHTDYLSILNTLFQSCVNGDDSPVMSGLFQSFGDGTQVGDVVKKGFDALSEKLLYQEYLKDHFGNYRAVKDDSTRKPSALTYEQEYLLAGNRSDRENLTDLISRIIFLRTILDFSTVIRDSAVRNEARAAACALVGFTGLPILVGLTQILILIAWAFAEALLDVTMIMQDKEVPVLKRTVTLQFPELFLISRAFLKEKAESVKSTQGLSMSYEDYLRMFLMLKSGKMPAYRSLDLMQENIGLRYDVAGFDITRCLYGFEADFKYVIPDKFIGLAFVHKFLGSDGKGFPFNESMEYSY